MIIRHLGSFVVSSALLVWAGIGSPAQYEGGWRCTNGQRLFVDVRGASSYAS